MEIEGYVIWKKKLGTGLIYCKNGVVVLESGAIGKDLLHYAYSKLAECKLVGDLRANFIEPKSASAPGFVFIDYSRPELFEVDCTPEEVLEDRDGAVIKIRCNVNNVELEETDETSGHKGDGGEGSAGVPEAGEDGGIPEGVVLEPEEEEDVHSERIV